MSTLLSEAQELCKQFMRRAHHAEERADSAEQRIAELERALSEARAALRDIPEFSAMLTPWFKKHAPAIKAAREAE
jgi:hypothetical protein